MNGFWGPPCNFVWSLHCSKQARKVLAWFLFLFPSFGNSTWWEAAHQVCFPFPIMLSISRPKCCDSICSTSAFLSFTPSPQEKYQRAAFITVNLWRVGYQYSGKPRVTHKQGDIAFMLQTFAVRFLLFSSTMKIWRVLIVWCRVLLWRKYSRASSLRMTYEMVQN